MRGNGKQTKWKRKEKRDSSTPTAKKQINIIKLFIYNKLYGVFLGRRLFVLLHHFAYNSQRFVSVQLQRFGFHLRCFVLFAIFIILRLRLCDIFYVYFHFLHATKRCHSFGFIRSCLKWNQIVWNVKHQGKWKMGMASLRLTSSEYRWCQSFTKCASILNACGCEMLCCTKQPKMLIKLHNLPLKDTWLVFVPRCQLDSRFVCHNITKKKKRRRRRRRQSQPQTRIRAQVLHLLSQNQKKQAMSTNAIPFFIPKMFAFLL